MRLREAHVPILLWVVTAAAIHWGGAEQSDRIARIEEGKTRLRLAAQEAIVEKMPALEVDLDVPPLEPIASAIDVKPADESEAVTDPNDPAKNPDEVEEKKKKKLEQEKPKPVEKPPQKPADQQQPEPPKPTLPAPPNTAPPTVVEPQPQEQKKIAVIQNQKDDEEKNDEAQYLAEKNHKVKPEDQTHATITSTTENDPNPTPGTSNGKPADKVGNGNKDQIAQDEDRPGEKVAPNVIPKTADNGVKKPNENPGKIDGNDLKPGAKTPPQPPAIASKTQPKPVETNQLPSPGKGVKTPTPGTPEVIASNDGTGGNVSTASSSNAAPKTASSVSGTGDGKKAIPPELLPKTGSVGGGKWVAGLDGKGPNGLGKLAMSETQLKGAIGMDELDRLKKVEGETKLSIHRGAWKSSSLERWRSAIENYTPGVKPGNQTNLGTAAAPWATYLAQIHVRLHPIFADGFVDGLDDLPAGHPLNDKTLVTRMEIVMKSDGTIDHLGIVKPSGVTAFDIAALDAVDRAAPFGKAPSAIVSPDGLVYLHWEFHRDDMRCSNVNAYPYVLKEGGTPVKPSPKEPPTPPTKNPEDGKKYGTLVKPKDPG